MKTINIDGLEKYSITTDGIVHSFHKRKHVIRKQSVKKGYNICAVMLNGQLKHMLVHRLVALTYIPNPENLPFINHKDGNKQNNNINNLEWISRLGNSQHAAATGLYKVKGDHGRARVVLNTQTGIFYGTRSEAYQTITNMGKSKFWNMLQGHIHNTSNFINV